jgi:serine phosphatase RsbU (regulator of sigma subunit)
VVAGEIREAQRESEQLADLLEPGRQQAREVTLAQSRASDHLSDYVLLAQPSALADVSRDLATASAILDALATLSSSDVDINTPLTNAIAAQSRWIQTDLEPTLIAMTASQQQRAAAITSSPEAARAFANMIATSTQLATSLDSQRTLLANQQTDLIRLLIGTLISAAVLGITMMIITVWGTKAWIVNPLLGFRNDLQRTRRQPTSPITVHGPDEFRGVMRDAEELRRELVAQIDETASAYEGLRQQAPLALTIATHLKRTQALTFPGLEGYGTVQSSDGVVTGDWWDVFACGEGGIGFVVGDVVGHGERAAVLALQMQVVLRSALRSGSALPDACVQAVDAIEQPYEFFTAIIGVIDATRDLITIVNAGHPPVFHLTSMGIRQYLPSGPLISKLGGRWQAISFPWQPGDALVAVTDGLTESRTIHGEELDSSGVEHLLREAPKTRSATEIAEYLLAAARGTSPDWGRDDVTCLVLRDTADFSHMAR